jgi:ubiquinone/menaquinone biosynthesis C-methylase UbiE
VALGERLERHGFQPLATRDILEVGCGTGGILAGMLEFGAAPERLTGVDLLESRIAEARQRFPDLRFATGNAEQLEFADASFDLLLLFTVFTSILDADMRRRAAAEAVRVLRPGGAVVWYDFRYNNPWNRHVRGIGRQTLRALFPRLTPDLVSLTLVPPLARRLGPLTSLLYPLLVRLPPLRTHYLGLLLKPTSEG